jgi:GT2 family glycosyltransferase
MTPAWSFVIPVGPGDGAWRALLDDLEASPAGCEVLLVFAQGHLPDATPAAPRVRCIEASAGRAPQLNAGIAAAAHPRVCLLHADTRLSPSALATLLAFVPGETELGYFDLRFHDGPWLMWLNTLGTWLRSRVFGLPFGDQGFSARRTLFDRLDGFDPDIMLGEDHALVWRLHGIGGRMRPLRATITTSARRYVEHGWWATTLRFGRLTLQQARHFRRREMPQ